MTISVFKVVVAVPEGKDVSEQVLADVLIEALPGYGIEVELEG